MCTVTAGERRIVNRCTEYSISSYAQTSTEMHRFVLALADGAWNIPFEAQIGPYRRWPQSQVVCQLITDDFIVNQQKQRLEDG